MKYIISLMDIEWSKNRYWFKGPGLFEGAHKYKKGYVGLFDRNTRKFMWFKIIKKCDNLLAYIVERKGKVQGYWNNLKAYNKGV